MKTKITFFEEFSMWRCNAKYVFLLICSSLPIFIILWNLMIASEPIINKYTDVTFSVIIEQIYGKEIEIPVERACNIINRLLYIEFGFFYIAAMMIINAIFILVHRKLQNNYSSKEFQIERDGTITSDIKFISVWLFIGAIFNSLMLYFGMDGKIYAFCSTYFVLGTLFHLFLRKGWFGYKIRRRVRVLED